MFSKHIPISYPYCVLKMTLSCREWILLHFLNEELELPEAKCLTAQRFLKARPSPEPRFPPVSHICNNCLWMQKCYLANYSQTNDIQSFHKGDISVM